MDRLTLLRSIKKSAYRHFLTTGRRYTLSSGQVSDEYVDVKTAILNRSVGWLLASHVTRVIADGPCHLIAGVELGGCLLAQLVGHMRARDCLVVRKDDRTHGTTTFGVDGLENLPPLHGNGDDRLDVWLVEDVITTGRSTLNALARLARFGRLRVAGVVAVVDREQGGVEAVRAGWPKLNVSALATLSEVRAAG